MSFIAPLSPKTESTPPRSESRKHLLEVTNSPDERAQKVVKKALFDSPPKNTLKLTPMPRTPSRTKLFSSAPIQLFKNEIPLLNDDWFNKAELPAEVNLSKIYRTLDNQCHYVVKQPPQKMSCGSGVLLMLYADLLLKVKSREIPYSFWQWYIETIGSNAKELKTAIENNTSLSQLGFTPYIQIYNVNSEILSSVEAGMLGLQEADFKAVNTHQELLEDLKAVLKISASSLIVSITHEKIEGHWIIIDEIINELIYIRDPYAGKAHSITQEELFANWPEEDPISCVYLKKPNSSDSKTSLFA